MEMLLSGQSRIEGRHFANTRLKEIYRARDYRPIWTDERGVRPEGRDLLELLYTADREGLRPEDYHVAALGRLVDARSPNELAKLEVLLAESVAEYGSDLQEGRVRSRLSYPSDFTIPHELDRLQILRDASESENLSAFLKRLHTNNLVYERLRQALQEYRRRAETADFEEIPSGGLLRLNHEGPRVNLLRQRLGLPPGERYDKETEQAVRDFQRRNSLQVDGIVGPDTFSILNLGPQERIDRILINMERARWLPDDLGRRFALVDIPGYLLNLYEGPRPVDQMRVIVGRQYWQTPIFAEEIEHVVVNPFWNVPQSITRSEIAVKMMSDPNYIRANNMRVFSGWGDDAQELDPLDVNWRAVADGLMTVRVRQDPGPQNALGRIKFMFPNQYSVYLHDTPAGQLFRKSRRIFSHGCIRVERPWDLAQFLFEATPGWDAGRLRQIMEAGYRQQVDLAEHVPVYITYFTVWVDESGEARFRPDVYNRDGDLVKTLMGS